MNKTVYVMDGSLNESSSGAVHALLALKQRVREQPPTDERLAQIWSAWNACPVEFLPEERIWTLTGFPQPRYQEALKSLLTQFGHLPFDGDEFSSTLQAASQWVALINSARVTEEKFTGLVQRHWAFEDADSQAYGRIAVFRTVAELRITNPGMVDKKSPTLADIQLLQERCEAYRAARLKAYEQLDRLLYKLPGMRKGQVIEHLRRALGVPSPPEDVPRHLYVARLDALGICSDSTRLDFFRDDLSKLSRAERQEFYNYSLHPRFGKDPYAGLRVWLMDNVPVFQRFDWRWPYVHTAAAELGLLDPAKHKSHESLQKWASSSKLTWKMNLAVGKPDKQHRTNIAASKPLLSPVPRFGEFLKQQSPDRD